MDAEPTGGPSPGRRTTADRDAALVAAALAGDREAFGRLYDHWYDGVWNLARRVVGDPEVAAEVAQDAFLSAWRNLGTLEDHRAFGGWLLRIARNASFNRQRREHRSQAVDDRGLAVIEASGASPSAAPAGFGVEDRARRAEDPEAVAGDAELVALVRESAGALGDRDAEVLDLQLRYGLTPAEIGDVMGMNRNAANQLCHRVRQRFAAAVRARVLWRGERPACAELDALLVSAGVDRFGAEAVKIADRHAPGCSLCAERRDLRLQPSVLFASVPLVVAPVLLKQQAAHALEAAGVPMDGSELGRANPPKPEPSYGPRPPDARPGATPRSRRVRRATVMAGAAALVLVATIAVLAARPDDGTVGDLATAAGSTAPTTAGRARGVDPAEPTSTTTSTVGPGTSTDPAPGPVPSTEPPLLPTDAGPPTTTAPPPPPAPVILVTLQPDTRPPSWNGPDAFPVLSWFVADAASVRVEGPKVDSSLLTGQLRLCPGVGSETFCSAPVGTYPYTVRAFDAEGREVAARTVTLRIA